MADLTYTMDINGAPALTTLNKVESQVSKLKGSFNALGAALGTIAFGSMIASANKFADSISDLSDATEISIQKILGFSAAVQANGGTTEGAQKGIAKLVSSIDDAANSAGGGREAFKQVGVSLDDLRTKTSSQIFEQAIKGLSGITDVATRARVATELLGKEAKLVNFKNVAGDFDAASAKAVKLASAYKAGADAQQALETNLKNLTSALLQVLEPLNKIAATVNVSVESFATLIKILAYAGAAYLFLGKGLATVTGMMNVIIPTLRASGGAFAWLGSQIMLIVANIGNIFKNLGRMVGIISGATNATTSFAAAFAAVLRVGLRFAGVVAVIMAVVEAVNYLIKSITGLDILDATITKFGELYNAAKAYFGLGDGPKGRSYSVEDAKRQQEYLDEKNESIKRGQEAMQKFNAEVAKAALDSKQSLMVQGQELSNMGFRLSFEKALIGKTEDQKELQTQMFDIEMKRIDLQDDYAKSIAKLQLEKSNTKDEEQNRLLGERIGIIKAEAKESDALYGRHKQGLTDQLVLLQNARTIEAARLQDQQNMVKAIEDQIARQQTLAGIMQGINDKKVDQGFETAQAGRNPLEKQMAQIQENARKGALEAGRAFAAGFEDMDLTAAQAKELADGLDKIAKSYEGIAKSQMDNLAASRTWEAGWKTAFDSYMDNATNAATRAGEVFSAVTSNMNNAIDNFVESGKLSFGDLAKSIIQDLIKIELKAQATKLLSMVGGGGGIFSAIGSLFGFAEGGNPPINKPSIVGEKGPELFVPRSAGTIIPNGAGGGGVVNKTYITNNISAIDSKSVAQMFAENRKALLGTVQLAQKELPYGNR